MILFLSREVTLRTRLKLLYLSVFSYFFDKPMVSSTTLLLSHSIVDFYIEAISCVSFVISDIHYANRLLTGL